MFVPEPVPRNLGTHLSSQPRDEEDEDDDEHDEDEDEDEDDSILFF